MTACCTPFVIPRFVVGGAGDGNRTYLISLRLRRRRLRKADVRFRPAKVSNGLRIQPIDHLLLNGDFQYVPDLQAEFLNVRIGFDTGHPTKSLRYYSGKVRDRALTHRSLALSGGRQCSNFGHSHVASIQRQLSGIANPIKKIVKATTS